MHHRGGAAQRVADCVDQCTGDAAVAEGVENRDLDVGRFARMHVRFGRPDRHLVDLREQQH